MLKEAMIAVASVVGGAVFLAVPASAEPADNPCELAVTFLCKFVPIAPHLEGDIDLTQQVPAADPNAPPLESLPPADICAAGCI